MSVGGCQRWPCRGSLLEVSSDFAVKYGAMSFPFVLVFILPYAIGSLGGQSHCRNLGDRMTFFRRSLIVSMLLLVADAVWVFWVHASTDPLDGAASEAGVREYLSEQTSNQVGAIVFMVAIVVLLMAQAISLVGELRAFVMMQSLDLKARDQIALHEGA